MKKKPLLLLAISGVIIVCGLLYAYKEYNRKNPSLSGEKVYENVAAAALIQSFENNDSLANATYLGKVLAVQGKVRAIESNGGESYTLIMGEPTSLSAVRCVMDTTENQKIKLVKEGDLLTVKGICTGFNVDDLLGSDVILNRCVIVNKQ